MPPPAPVEARYGSLHNLGMAIVALAMIVAGGAYLLSRPDPAPPLSLSNPGFMMSLLLGAALLYYAGLGIFRFADRTPQVVVDRDGIRLGFGRDRRFAWNEIRWVRLHRLSLRPQLLIGLDPDVFVAANLNLSAFNLDDSLRTVRGVPAAVAVRDNGLDTSAARLLEGVRRFRPNLVKS